MSDGSAAHVAVVTGPEPQRELLAKALERGGLWSNPAVSGPVLVLVDVARRDTTSAIGVDPAFVEDLVDLLKEHGAEEVTVGVGPTGDDRWLENRDPVVVADLVGYRFTTPSGNDYDVANLAEDLVPAPVPTGSCLAGAELPRAWVEAPLRICVARNRTDEELVFTLTAHALLALLPESDRAWHYRGRLKPWDLVTDLLRHVPPHFAVVDATVSNHGRFGGSRPRPIGTHTVIAGPDALLVDFVGAVKMGVDPYDSPENGKALREIGLPPGYEVDGSLATYDGWVNPHPLAADAMRRLSEVAILAEGRQALLAEVDTDLFPFTSLWRQRANRVVSRFADAADRDPWSYAVATWFAWGTAAAVDALDGWRILYDKDRLRWRDVPLDLPLGDFGPDDYEAVAGYIEPLEVLVRAAPADQRGLRWRQLDRSVLFEMARVFEVDFDDFVGTVDIARAIGFMYDYIGGRTVPVRQDEAGRVVHQAERNLYLPQPNWMVLYGGTHIDVAKLELIRYGSDEHKIMWRTVRSANGSAEYDDGSVTFTRVAGGTQVSVSARQKFTLPAAWQLVDVDLYPELIHPIIADAYGRFFDRTLDNFRAAYEGEAFRVGSAWPDERPASELAARARRLGSELRDGGAATMPSRLARLASGRGGDSTATGGEIDDDGFVHFPGSGAEVSATAGAEAPVRPWEDAMSASAAMVRASLAFWGDLGRAVARDMGTYRADEG